MYTDGTQEFLVDQGLYYPAATNYGYYCTGFESPVGWEDQQRFFSTDGLEIQYTGAQTDSYPYVYYTPNYGYGQSAYNPYSPCVPGAVIGVDGPFVGTHHYYTIPAFQNTVSSPAYLPVMAHSRPETPSGGLLDLGVGTGVSVGNRALRHNMNSHPSAGSSSLSTTTHMPFSSQMNSFTGVTEGSRIYAGSSRQFANNNVFYPATESHNLQNRSALASSQRSENISHANVLATCNQLKTLSLNSGFSDTGLSGQMAADQSRPRAYRGGTTIDGSGNPDALSEQNRGPRVSRLRNQFSVKSYTTKIGDCNAEGNIVIYADRYNKDDFPVDYFNAKFFVIKSYSEDDVHKSIKYNVWSSTPNGNRKLNIAYEDAQRRAMEDSIQCPVFLFFSVNASGQFCGVAEMIGPVDFYKDMDFWQQDKWNGSFPVKWHFIKDVPNANFRHIILENNENKPVTNSRDTQEVRCQQGMEMLRIFKNYTLKSSLLDDFMYYEKRQQTIQEEKMRLTMKNHQGNFYVSREDQACSRDSVGGSPVVEDCRVDIRDNGSTVHGSSELEEKEASTSAQEENINGQRMEGSLSAEEDGARSASPDLNVGALSIDPKQNEVNKPAPSTASVPVDVVTVGSMPVVINGKNDAVGFLRVGTIPLDPRALRKYKGRPFSSSKS